MSRHTEAETRYQTTRRATLVGAFTNGALAVLQILGGLLAQSQALIADGLHTLSDLASDFMVVFAARKASAPADQDHPYGHGRIETLATVLLGLVLLGVALGILIDAFNRLMDPETLLTPGPIALLLAATAIIAKETLYRYTVRVAKRISSGMLLANAWHHRSDVLSSVVVLIGIGATLMGFPFMDALAAAIVALMIGLMGARIIWRSASELIDTGIKPEEEKHLLDSVSGIDGVTGVHELRTRHMGNGLLADIHVEVDPRISVSEGHRIAESVAQTLRQARDDLREVLVHIDPEDDRAAAPSSHLPSRSELLTKLRLQWQPIPGALPPDEVVLHYLDGHIDIDLHLPLDRFASAEDAETTRAEIIRASQEIAGIGQVRVLLS